MKAPNLAEWVGFIKSVTSDLSPLRVEARLAAQRTVLGDALARSGRQAEARALERAAAAWSLPRVSIDEVGRASEAIEASRAVHGPRRDLSPAGMLAAEAAAAGMLIEQPGSPRFASAGRAILERSDRLLAAMEARLLSGVNKLDPFVEKYADPASERAVLFRSLVDGWRQDLETLSTLRRDLPADRLDRERIARLRHAETLVARLFKEGMLTEPGLKARLAQARTLLANEHRPARRIRTRGQIVLAEIVDVWDPRWADAVADSDRYLGDLGHSRGGMLLNPPGRGLPKPRPLRVREAVAETRWLAASGQTAEAVRALRFYAPRLARNDALDPRWLALAVQLEQAPIAARLAIDGLIAANAAPAGGDRRIDRIAALVSQGDGDALAAALRAHGARAPERGVAAAFLFCGLGRAEAALSLVDEVGDGADCGPLFFRLARAFAPPGGAERARIVTADDRAAEWVRNLPSIEGRPVSVVAPRARPTPDERAAAGAGAEALARQLAAWDIVAPDAAVFARAMAARIAACRRSAHLAEAAPGPAALLLGFDREADGLLAPWARAAGPAIFGTGASAARVWRLKTPPPAPAPGDPAGARRRDELARASYEDFRIASGEPGAGGSPIAPFAFETLWSRLAEAPVVAAVLDRLAPDPGPARDILAAGLTGFSTRRIAEAQRAAGSGVAAPAAPAAAVGAPTPERLEAALARALRGEPAVFETADPVVAARYAGLPGLEIRPSRRKTA